MRKKSSLLLVGLLTVSLLGGCSNKSTTNEDTNETNNVPSITEEAQPTVTEEAQPTESATEESDDETASEVNGIYKDGTYTGTGTGKNGDIVVDVVVEGGNITAITLTSHNETPGIYEGAEEGVVASIIETQSTEVDTVSGATLSSNGIMEAVNNALAEAK